MKVGFTGTRDGMSPQQIHQLLFVLGVLGVERGQEFHYGAHKYAQLKADKAAARHAADYGFVPVPHSAEAGEELARNRELVAAVDILIAAPIADKEELRSGTWATVRYARARRIPIVMLSRGDD